MLCISKSGYKLISVRKATHTDNKDVYDWRNDKLTRQMSLQNNFIDKEEHNNWFEASLNNEGILLVICEEVTTKTKFAIVRFDIRNDEALISINLAPSQRGKGLAKQCLTESMAYFGEVFPKILSLYAEIKEINLASKHLFEGVGFNLNKVTKEVMLYEYINFNK